MYIYPEDRRELGISLLFASHDCYTQSPKSTDSLFLCARGVRGGLLALKRRLIIYIHAYYIYIYTYIYEHTHTRIHTRIHTHTYTYTYAYTRTQTLSLCLSHIHSLTHIHTHTHRRKWGHLPFYVAFSFMERLADMKELHCPPYALAALVKATGQFCILVVILLSKSYAFSTMSVCICDNFHLHRGSTVCGI